MRRLESPPLFAICDPSHYEDGQALDIVFLRKRCGKSLGICDDELDAPQAFVIDISAGLRRATACTCDYSAVPLTYAMMRQRTTA